MLHKRSRKSTQWNVINSSRIPAQVNISLLNSSQRRLVSSCSRFRACSSRNIWALLWTFPGNTGRHVAYGKKDYENNQLIYNSTTVIQSSAIRLVVIAAIMGFDVWAEDILRAFLQSARELLREVYLRPNSRLNVPTGRALKLLQTLSGLDGSGDYSHVTFLKHSPHD